MDRDNCYVCGKRRVLHAHRIGSNVATVLAARYGACKTIPEGWVGIDLCTECEKALVPKLSESCHSSGAKNKKQMNHLFKFDVKAVLQSMVEEGVKGN